MLQQFYPAPLHEYRYELHKDFNFAAAHFVPHEGAGACANMHGHTYFVDITVAGNELDEMGFLVNFSELKKLVHGRFDHKVLNDDTMLFTHSFNVAPEYFPTTEVVAQSIWSIVQIYLNTKPNQPKCLQVLLRETPTSYVVFRPARGGMLHA